MRLSFEDEIYELESAGREEGREEGAGRRREEGERRVEGADGNRMRRSYVRHF
jgi:hypothetical protein